MKTVRAARLVDAYADDATVASMAGGYEDWDGTLSRSLSGTDDDRVAEVDERE